MKQLLKATLMFIISLTLFTAVVFAWYSSSNDTDIQPINATSSHGSPVAYEITYYTQNHVFKYDIDTNRILVYDEITATFVQQDALPIDLLGYSFNNMFVSDYDPIIEENNWNKNVIAEISLSFTGDSVTFKNAMVADSQLATEAVSQYPYTTSRPYYLSEVTYVQSMVSNIYNAFTEGENKYDALNQAFSTVDLNDELMYPMHTFYDNGIYSGFINFGSTQLASNITTYKLYYNFTYFDSKINEILTNESVTVDIDNMSFIVFFPDIKFNIVMGGNA